MKKKERNAQKSQHSIIFQVLSSKLMPTQNRDGGANARMFKENFLAAGGLR